MSRIVSRGRTHKREGPIVVESVSRRSAAGGRPRFGAQSNCVLLPCAHRPRQVMGGKKHSHGGAKKKRGHGGSKSRGGGSTPRAPQVEGMGPPSIQEQLKSVSFLARVSAKPGAPCVCSCTPWHRSNSKSCAPFGTFCTVPVDVTLLLLSHLSAHCLLGRVALLNSNWRRLAASAELWRPLCLARWPSLDELAPDGIRDWLVVYALWHSGAAKNMLRLLKFCPLSATAPNDSELLIWHKWWCLHRKLNTCPFGGVELFRRTPLCDVQLYRPNPVLDDAFERCRDELVRKYRCGTYTHDLYTCVSHAEMRQIQVLATLDLARLAAPLTSRRAPLTCCHAPFTCASSPPVVAATWLGRHQPAAHVSTRVVWRPRGIRHSVGVV